MIPLWKSPIKLPVELPVELPGQPDSRVPGPKLCSQGRAHKGMVRQLVPARKAPQRDGT